MTDEELIKIGKMCKETSKGNLYIGSFAAELIGESYPIDKEMWDIIFKSYDDKELGKKLIAWSDKDTILK